MLCTHKIQHWSEIEESKAKSPLPKLNFKIRKQAPKNINSMCGSGIHTFESSLSKDFTHCAKIPLLRSMGDDWIIYGAIQVQWKFGKSMLSKSGYPSGHFHVCFIQGVYINGPILNANSSLWSCRKYMCKLRFNCLE